jgi:hypothetical protein
MNYDPNLTNSGKMADQTVELTFQQWTAKATFKTVVGGNCTGLSVIECAIDNITEKLEEDGGVIVLKKPNGDTLECELWECELEKMLVCARIIAIKPEGKK